MFVAIAQSTRSLRRRSAAPSRRRASATLSVVTREVSSTTSEKVVRSANRPRCSPIRRRVAVALRRCCGPRPRRSAGAAELAQAVEVAEQRHVRVGRVVGVARDRPRRGRHARAAPSSASQVLRMTTFGLRPCAAMPRYSRAAPARRAPSGRRTSRARSGPGGGKTCVSGRPNSAWIWSCARRTVAVEATIFGRTARPSSSPQAERVDGRLVQPDHRAERAGDQVQLVLDDQVGRRQRRGQRDSATRLGRRRRSRSRRGGRRRRAALRSARPRAAPRTCRRSRSGSRQPPVDRLVDGDDRQRPVAVEIAVEVRADDPQLGRGCRRRAAA